MNNLTMTYMLKNQSTYNIKEILSILFLVVLNLLFNGKINFNTFLNYLKNILFNYKFYNESKIIFNATDKNSSHRYRSLMYYIASKCNTINIVKENEIKKYNQNTGDYDLLGGNYIVSQNNSFLINDEINGIVHFGSKEEAVNNDKTINIETTTLEIYSKNKTIQELINFVENCEKKYSEYLKNKNTENQLYIDISWNTAKKDTNIFYTPWNSTARFNNRFFKNKDFILKKINNFLNNKKWYLEKGQPYTLGILLWGEPGCGKTGFIKALANETGKHIINIKLSYNFDFNKLNKIIFNEEIETGLIIPLNKRIIVFEDIDCMTDIIKERPEKEESCEESDKDNILKSKKNILTKSEDATFDILMKKYMNECENNNLSYILNMLDGIKESSDRIIIMTTNKPESLDKALIRSGRIDININFEKAYIDDIKNIINYFWDSDIDTNEFPDSFNNKLSHADIINICKSSDNVGETLKLLESTINNT